MLISPMKGFAKPTKLRRALTMYARQGSLIHWKPGTMTILDRIADTQAVLFQVSFHLWPQLCQEYSS